MFKKLFDKKAEKHSEQIQVSKIPNSPNLPFELLVLNYLKNYGIDQLGNCTNEKIEPTQEEVEWIKLTLNTIGFEDNNFIERLVIEERNEGLEKGRKLSASDFAKQFVQNYHNTKIEKYAPDYVIIRNKAVADAYSNIITTIDKIQNLLDDEFLKTRILSDYRGKQNVRRTIYQCATRFFLLSLGCDEHGRYNIVYSIDFRIIEMISADLTNMLLRRIYEFSKVELEPFLKIGTLNQDCVRVFDELLELTKVEIAHTEITT